MTKKTHTSRDLETQKQTTDKKKKKRATLEDSVKSLAHGKPKKRPGYDEYYRSLIGTTSQFFWTLNAEGQVEMDVPAWRAFTGQTLPEILGSGWLDAVHPSDRERIIQTWGETMDSKGFYEAEFRARRHDGSYRTLLASGFPIYKQDGTLREWVGVTTDITERKELENKLRQSEQKFRSTFEQAPVGIAHIAPDGHLLLVNQKLCDIVGYTYEELNHLSFHAILPTEVFLENSSFIQSISKYTYAKEQQYQHKDGSLLWVNMTVNPVRDETGEILYFIAVAEDITERKAVEQRTHGALDALLAMAASLVLHADESDTEEVSATPPEDGVARQLAKLTCRVLDCRGVGVMTLDPQSELLRPIAVAGISSEHKQRWWTTQQQAHHHFQESFTPAQASQLRNNEVLLLKTTQPQLHSLLAPHPTRTMLVAPMSIGNQLIGLLVLDHGDREHPYLKDELALTYGIARLAALVIERKRLLNERAAAQAGELAQRAANKHMEAFLGLASHELKTPLTTMKVNVQVAERLLNGLLQVHTEVSELANKKEALQEMLRCINRQVEVLTRLVNDLVDISRIQANKLELHMRPQMCDLAAIVQEAVNDQQRVHPTRTIRLSMKCTDHHHATGLPSPIGNDETLTPIFADPDRIAQVVNNYLTNALRYSPATQPVEVRVQVESEQARVSVRDQGPGLSPEEQERVWERFYQVQHSEKNSNVGAGLGLGLYISRSIVEWHHGQVGILSTPGEGSTFWFTLPLAHQHS